MKSLRQELWMQIPERMGFANITSKVREAIGKSGVKHGLVLVNTN